ncbi:HIRA-interacting protein 5 [Ascobolus immersus RN42]|uniref:HIRA-interacting protein 5 n=1 Tax=Ascobolus immersus RN42 TaxID=1160509 RepID=A0A3N4IQK5_ASCIM|nr:HIRA-interacting protein 5 [Ascobolus immersus RN42]
MASTIRPLVRTALRAATLTATRSAAPSATRPLSTLVSRPLPSRRTLARAASPIFKRTLFIQTESTPNADALKFIPGGAILGANQSSIEFTNGRSAHSSPLARKLFAVDGVHAVFIGPDFITVTKTSEASWAFLKPEVFSIITEILNSGTPIVDVENGLSEREDTAYDENDTETVSMIKELLDTRIRPAIQEDGGDIVYKGFEDGIVLLKLQGACKTCDSSTVTLKNGIEGMLMHYIEEVKGVKQVLDPEEEIAIAEFEKFEAQLEAQKKNRSN